MIESEDALRTLHRLTCREKLAIEHPDKINDRYIAGCSGCPWNYDYAKRPAYCSNLKNETDCIACWNREVEEPDNAQEPTCGAESCTYDCEERCTDQPVIKDSGNRRQFDTGAVRDIQEGKGRCDLMPLRVLSMYAYCAEGNEDAFYILLTIAEFMEDRNVDHLIHALARFKESFTDWPTMFLEVSKHFEEGAKKYGENNWQKGIPVNCYIDSAVRHYLKWLRGDTDEPHDRAFVWNLMCCIWEVECHRVEEESNV